MFRFKMVSALFALSLVTVSFNTCAAEKYNVFASLSHKDKSFASPVLIVTDGIPSNIEVSGPNGYKLSLTLTGIADGKLKIATVLDSSHGSMAPVLVVQSGKPVSVSVGDLKLSLTVNRVGN